MATLVKPVKTEYRDANGKRVKKGTRGAKKTRVRATKWYAQGVPSFPPKKRIPLASDKAVARRLMAELVAKAERGEAAAPDRSAARKPLSEHLEAFGREMALGMASRAKTKRLPDPEQVALTMQRIRDALAGCGLTAVGDLNAAAPAKLAEHLQGRTRLERKDGGLSQQSAAFALGSVRRFVWWLAERANVPVRVTLFDTVPGFNPAADRRHARREIPPAEMARVLQAARTSARVHRGMTGEDRYHLYITAFGTGYRAGELSVLTPECFELDAATPVAVLPAKYTKNKKPARQPLPPGVAYQLRPYLATKPAGQRVWQGTWNVKPAKMLKLDLKAAGVPYRVETPDGPKFADFHALRHSYLSSLAAAGVNVKELQELARHSNPTLTLGVYTHARPEALRASVALLPLPAADGSCDPVAALSRDELEAALRGMTALAAGLWTALTGVSPVAPRVAPALAPAGDNGRPTGTPRPRKASA